MISLVIRGVVSFRQHEILAIRMELWSKMIEVNLREEVFGFIWDKVLDSGFEGEHGVIL